jgi:GTP-binding protein
MANVVAIVGRPNVGKSTLFNRLVEARKAIIDKESGTTRDRHYGYATWNGRHFTVIDTGGYMPTSNGSFDQAILNQASKAIEEASLILFLVDCHLGLAAGDQELANIVRNTSKPILLVVNKADNIAHEMLAHEFYSLGMGDPYLISAISGSGTGDLLDKVVEYCQEENTAQEEIPRLTILGKPNVGKSSLLNVLLGQERSIVSPVSGTTRDALDSTYKLYGKDLILTDTAGIRKKAKVSEHVEFYSVMRALKALQNSDVCLLMIDAEQGLQAQDVNLMTLAQRYKKGMLLLVNKWDLIAKDQHTAQQYRKAITQKLGNFGYIPILFISTITKQRIYQTIEKALEVYQNKRQRIATSTLNKVMLPVIERYAPPAVKGKYIKIKYVTQLPSYNPVFAFFCNLPQYIKPSYKSYLENQLRKHFNLEGVPITLVFRKK